MRAARATAAQRKKNQPPVEEATSEELEELFEDALPNVGTPGASVSGRGNSPLVLIYAPQVGDLARDRLEPPGPAFGADGEMRPSSPIPVGSETLMFLSGFLQYGGFLIPDDVGDRIHSFALRELSLARGLDEGLSRAYTFFLLSCFPVRLIILTLFFCIFAEDSNMSDPASEMRRLIKERSALKAARRSNVVVGAELPPTSEKPGTTPGRDEALAVVPLRAMEPAADGLPDQPPVIDLEAGEATNRSSGKRGPVDDAREGNLGKRPRTTLSETAEESHGESRLTAKEIPAPPVLPLRPTLLEEGESALRDEQSRLVNRTWESGRCWRDDAYKALMIRRQVEFSDRPAEFSAPQPIVDRLAAEVGFRPKMGQDIAPMAADLLD